MQILIGGIAIAVLLLGNFIVAVPIILFNDKIFSRLFALMSFIFAIVFYIYGGAILKGRQYIYDYVSTECSNPIGRFGDYDRVNVIAD